MKEYYEAVKQVFDFLNEGGDPYKGVGPVKLHHFISKQIVPSNRSDCTLFFLENVRVFHEERSLKKKKKVVADTIIRITVPQKIGKL